MIEVQLDKNSDAKDLKQSCFEQGQARCCSLPHDLKDADDPDVIAFAITKARVLLTYDRTIAEDNVPALTNGSTGVVVIEFGDDEDKKMTHRQAMKILAQFKAEYPQWHSLKLENCVVHLQPREIRVNRIANGVVLRTGTLDRNIANWQADLQDLLTRNAALQIAEMN